MVVGMFVGMLVGMLEGMSTEMSGKGDWLTVSWRATTAAAGWAGGVGAGCTIASAMSAVEKRKLMRRVSWRKRRA